jgi:hypothetical protein
MSEKNQVDQEKLAEEWAKALAEEGIMDEKEIAKPDQEGNAEQETKPEGEIDQDKLAEEWAKALAEEEEKKLTEEKEKKKQSYAVQDVKFKDITGEANKATSETQRDIEFIEFWMLDPFIYDENENLTKAALGFLRSAQATEKDIYFLPTPKGEKIAVKIEKKGKSAETILKDIIKESIKKIEFPKAMRWGENKLSWARPLRWLLVLFGPDVISMEIAGVVSGKISYGNRFQNLENAIEIDLPAEYEEKLSSVFVIADRKKRKSIIAAQMREIFQTGEEEVVEDKKLLEIVTDLAEFPTAVSAKFEKKYL